MFETRERRKPPIIQDPELDAPQRLEKPGVTTIAARERQRRVQRRDRSENASHPEVTAFVTGDYIEVNLVTDRRGYELNGLSFISLQYGRCYDLAVDNRVPPISALPKDSRVF